MRHRVCNWSHATPGGPGYAASWLWLTVDESGVLLQREGHVLGEAPVARLDLYTIQSWRGTPSQLHLQLTDGQIVSVDVQGGGYGVVSELEHVCQTLAAQQPLVATVATATLVSAAGTAPSTQPHRHADTPTERDGEAQRWAAPSARATRDGMDTSAVEAGVTGCVARLQEQMSLRWLVLAAEIARLRTAAEAMAASAAMADHIASRAAPESELGAECSTGAEDRDRDRDRDRDSAHAGTEDSAEGGKRVCGACTFKNDAGAEHCAICGCALSVGVSVSPAGGSAAESAALAGAAAVLGEAVDADDLSALAGALSSLQAGGNSAAVSLSHTL